MQSMMDGAGNTIGNVAVYSIIVLIIFLWYKNHKDDKKKDKDKGDDNNDNNDPGFLTTALNFSKTASAMRNANRAETGGLFGTPSNDAGGGWI